MNTENVTIPRLSWRLAELALASGLSLPFLRKEAYAGNLKTRKVGGAVIVLDEDARAFLRGQETSASAEVENSNGDPESAQTRQDHGRNRIASSTQNPKTNR